MYIIYIWRGLNYRYTYTCSIRSCAPNANAWSASRWHAGTVQGTPACSRSTGLVVMPWKIPSGMRFSHSATSAVSRKKRLGPRICGPRGAACAIMIVTPRAVPLALPRAVPRVGDPRRSPVFVIMLPCIGGPRICARILTPRAPCIGGPHSAPACTVRRASARAIIEDLPHRSRRNPAFTTWRNFWPTQRARKAVFHTFTPSTRWARLARSWRPLRPPQGAWKAVLVDPGTGSARFDAWSAARGLWGWCASRARPADLDDRLQAHASRARRSKRTRHSLTTREDSSLRCAGDAAGDEPMWF